MVQEERACQFYLRASKAKKTRCLALAVDPAARFPKGQVALRCAQPMQPFFEQTASLVRTPHPHQHVDTVQLLRRASYTPHCAAPFITFPFLPAFCINDAPEKRTAEPKPDLGAEAGRTPISGSTYDLQPQVVGGGHHAVRLRLGVYAGRVLAMAWRCARRRFV